jgi:hypothetical protein
MNTQAKRAGTDSSEVLASNFLRDPYLEWARGEGVPIVEDFTVDLNQVQTQHWGRMDAPGVFVHTWSAGPAGTQSYVLTRAGSAILSIMPDVSRAGCRP